LNVDDEIGEAGTLFASDGKNLCLSVEEEGRIHSITGGSKQTRYDDTIHRERNIVVRNSPTTEMKRREDRTIERIEIYFKTEGRLP